DNGGETLTRAPLFGSPLRTVIPQTFCTLSFDQRNEPREGFCDIGAVESGSLLRFRALLVVGLLEVLDPGDAAIAQRLESLGGGVDIVVEEREPIEPESFDLILVSSTADVSRIDVETLMFAETPLLTWNPSLYFALGMIDPTRGEAGVTDRPQSTLEIVDPKHPLAGGLRGAVEVASARTSFTYATPLRSANVIATLADEPDFATIFAYERGAELMRGRAPAPRVGFYWSTRTPTVLRNDFEFFQTALVTLIPELDEPSGPRFQRGDANGDSQLDISDGIAVLLRLFTADAAELPCQDAADANDSGELDISDAVTLFQFLFLGGDTPPGAGECLPDETEDRLSCEDASACS
ncbi:MAG: choice-of-anchor Q domain-containing protein, partial [Planctomycetota bacterium]